MNEKFNPEQSSETPPEAEVDMVVSHDAHELASQQRSTIESLFSALKMYRGKEMSLFQIKGKSDKVSRITEQLAHILEAGGAPATADSLIARVVEEAMKASNEKDFADHVLDPAKLVVGSELHKFYVAFATGLEKQAEETAAAA